MVLAYRLSYVSDWSQHGSVAAAAVAAVTDGPQSIQMVVLSHAFAMLYSSFLLKKGAGFRVQVTEFPARYQPQQHACLPGEAIAALTSNLLDFVRKYRSQLQNAPDQE